MSRRPRLLSPGRPNAKSETAEKKPPAEKVADEMPAAQNAVLEQTDRRPDTARRKGGAHARARRNRTNRDHIWKAVFAIIFLALLATAVTLVLLQSAGVINWGFLGPNA